MIQNKIENGDIKMIEIINENQKISDCEEMIMKILWESEDDLNLLEVTDRVATRYGKIWKLQTVATFLTRLKSKGWIDIYKVKRYSYYHPLVSVDEYRKEKIMEVFDLYAAMKKTARRKAIIELVNEIAKTF